LYLSSGSTSSKEAIGGGGAGFSGNEGFFLGAGDDTSIERETLKSIPMLSFLLMLYYRHIIINDVKVFRVRKFLLRDVK